MYNVELVFSNLRGAVSSIEVLACSLEFLEMDKCQSRCAWFISEVLYTLIDQLEDCLLYTSKESERISTYIPFYSNRYNERFDYGVGCMVNDERNIIRR